MNQSFSAGPACDASLVREGGVGKSTLTTQRAPSLVQAGRTEILVACTAGKQWKPLVTTNCFIHEGHCQLAGYENTILGYKTRLYRMLKDYLDKIESVYYV